jgi:hypothetical protein
MPRSPGRGSGLAAQVSRYGSEAHHFPRLAIAFCRLADKLRSGRFVANPSASGQGLAEPRGYDGAHSAAISEMRPTGASRKFSPSSPISSCCT